MATHIGEIQKKLSFFFTLNTVKSVLRIVWNEHTFHFVSSINTNVCVCACIEVWIMLNNFSKMNALFWVQTWIQFSVHLELIVLFVCVCVHVRIKLVFVVISLCFAQVTHYIFFADSNYSFRCELSNFNTDPVAMHAAQMCYYYFILKLADYLDTIFFIVRKKSAHVSFLHVYHHVAVSVGAYVCVLFATGLYTNIPCNFPFAWFVEQSSDFPFLVIHLVRVYCAYQ